MATMIRTPTVARSAIHGAHNSAKPSLTARRRKISMKKPSDRNDGEDRGPLGLGRDRLPEFLLRQLDLLADEGGEVLGDLLHELTGRLSAAPFPL